MLKTLITYGLGVYTGIYVAQNYEIDKLETPQSILAKFMKFVDEDSEAIDKVDNPQKLWEKLMKYIEDSSPDKKK